MADQRSDDVAPPPTQLEAVGDQIGKIPVEITYRIIELFSAGLYSSPNKAIEELVSNAFDAQASRVDVILPANAATPEATIWVVDDGESMDLDGLRGLWQIARSTKADRAPRGGRLPIGKFGIGKLATYVLARKLTYVAFKGNDVLAVTMDFGSINKQSDAAQQVNLDVVSLDDESLRTLLESLRMNAGGEDAAQRIFDLKAAGKSWTAVAMSDPKPLAAQIKHGRLEWLLSTALPNNPQFQVHLNGKRVTSKVEQREPLAIWRIGENPRRPDGFAGPPIPSGITAIPESTGASVGADQDGPYVELPGLPGVLRGEVAIYLEELTQNKAAAMGRSNGIFVMVRQRLINLDDPLFGLPALSHASFGRFRLVVNVDGLDSQLTSARESVKQGDEVEQIQAFLRFQFNVARRIYESHMQEKEKAAQLADKIGRSARSLTRRPLFGAIEKALNGSVDQLSMVVIPSNLTPAAVDSLLDKLRTSLESEQGLIESITPVPLGAEHMISRYDPVMQCVEVNTLHPFYANYIEGTGSPEPFNVVAVTEVLTEAYLLEEGVSPDNASALMRRRDSFLRELVASNRRGPAAIAQNLIDSGSSEKGLEAAVAEAFTSLGFAVTPIGGKGEPDGLATALLGVRGGQRADYKISYDAKSTGNRAVSASHVGIQNLFRHARQYSTNLVVVVAPDFEGASDENSSLLTDIRYNSQTADPVFITPVRVKDFAVLVAVAARRQLGFSRLRDFVERCRTPDEARAWIRAHLDEPADQTPLKEILGAVEDVAREAEDCPTLSTVSWHLKQKYAVTLKREQLEEHLKAVARLVPGFLSLSGEEINLDSSADKILQEIGKQSRELDDTVLNHAYAVSLLENPPLPPPAPNS